jgi:hypothetical protein
MSATNIIIGVALGGLLAAALIIWRRRYLELFSALLVVGIVGLAVVVTVYRVHQYWSDRATDGQIAQAQPIAASGSSAAPTVQPPIGVAILPPLVRGPAGAAAPSVVHNPHAGNP